MDTRTAVQTMTECDERKLLREMWECWTSGGDGDSVFSTFGKQIKKVLASGETEPKR